jgi:hypothetical protein
VIFRIAQDNRKFQHFEQAKEQPTPKTMLIWATPMSEAM